MTELLSLPFMQKALIAGLMMSFLAGYYGVFMVQRRASFLGSGLAHAAFGGVALGLMLGLNPLWITLPFTVIVALVITWVKTHTSLSQDTVIGILFSLAMAFGIVFLSFKENYTAEAFSYLFGSILTVNRMDLIISAGVCLLTLLTFSLWSRWAYATFDQELARSDGIKTERDDYVLALMIALTVVISVKILGIVLITAFLVIPAASAQMVSKNFSSMTIFAIEIGFLSTLIGLYGSYFLDIPSGATIILTQGILFFTIMGIQKIITLCKRT